MTRLVATSIAAGFAGLAVAVLIAVAPAVADDAANEATYSAYHRAIHAATLCEDRKFGEVEHQKMAEVIDVKINHALGAGRRLTLIERAKSETGKLVDDKGCADPAVLDSLSLFHADLAPAL